MNANNLSLGNQYTFDRNNKCFSFYKEHGIYVVCGFENYSDSSVLGVYETYTTFAQAKKSYLSLIK